MSDTKRFASLLEYYRYHKAKNGVTQEQLRRRWGLKRQSHVHALLYGKCLPRPRLARIISEDTGLDLLTIFNLRDSRQPRHTRPCEDGTDASRPGCRAGEQTPSCSPLS